MFMDGPRVLVVLGTSEGWSRGILRGLSSISQGSGWQLIHYHPSADLDWLSREWAPAVAVIGPEATGRVLEALSCPVVSVNLDRSPDRIASVWPDEEHIADLALRHLSSRGLEHLTTFRFSTLAFALARVRAFEVRARDAGARLAPGFGPDPADPRRPAEDPTQLVAWLRALPRPCGVFACCDAWGRVVARYARAAGLRVPEDLALVGVDNDPVECELIMPPLSSVAVPWHLLGEEAAKLVRLALAGKDIQRKRRVVSPVDVVARRSSDVLAVDDPLVRGAVGWIREHAAQRLSVPMVSSAVTSSRQRLERRFRAALGRTVQQEIRRARVEAVKGVLRSTALELGEVAKQTGFASAALLSVVFQREIGMPPGAYRRRMRDIDDAMAD